MRIATKLFAGYGTLIALTTLVLVYQVVLIHRLERIQETLARGNFRAAEVSLDMMWDLEGIEEYTRKSWLLDDPGYAAQRDEFQHEFAVHLRSLDGLELSPGEQVEIGRLRRFWAEWQAAVEPAPPPAPPSTAQELPEALSDQIAKLQAQAKTLYQAALRERETELRRGNAMAHQAKWISISAAVFALALSTVVSLVVLRSIAEPLRHLTAGTRALSEGKFFYRLDTSRQDEFAQLAKDFNTMTVRLDELTAMKKGFVSHVSHELKAPLASIQETLHLLLEQIAGPLNPKQHRLLELSFQSSKRLSTMLANLLDLSRHEAGVMEYDRSRHDLAAIVRGAIHQFADPAAQKEIAIIAELPAEPVVVECDPDRMLQVCGNLLDNAIKFAPRGSSITAGLRRVEAVPEGLPQGQGEHLGPPGAEGAYALVTVADRGPGVAAARRQIIFENLRQESFDRVAGTRKLPGQGVGLGLAVSKIIMDAHEGAIWVEENPGGGSIFRVLLRAAPVPPRPAAVAGRVGGTGDGGRAAGGGA